MTTLLGEPKEKWFEKYKGYLRPDNLLKIGGVFTAIIYVIGYIVVTLNLSKYGVSTFEILRLQYLMAGFWYVYPFFITLVMCYIIIPGIKYLDYVWKEISNFIKWLVILLILFLLVAIGSAYGFVMEGINFQAHLHLYIMPFCFMIVIVITGRIKKFFLPRKRNILIEDNVMKWLLVASLFIIPISYLVFFADQIYPNIPSNIGGGKLINVSITTTKNLNLENIAIQREDKSFIVNCKLLLETSDRIILLPYDSSNTAISINKECIATMVLNPED
ncbi:MAG: hypothetical protein ACOYVF_13400 [Candidatus Zixiibacteriota bacterium]